MQYNLKDSEFVDAKQNSQTVATVERNIITEAIDMDFMNNNFPYFHLAQHLNGLVNDKDLADGYVLARLFTDIYSSTSIKGYITGALDFFERLVGTRHFVRTIKEFIVFLLTLVVELKNNIYKCIMNNKRLKKLWDGFFTGDENEWLTAAKRGTINTLSGIKRTILEVQTESVKTGLRNVKSRLAVIMSSELVTSVRNFVLSLVGYNLFPDPVSDKLIKHVGPARPCSLVGLVDVSIEALISMLNLSDQVMAGEGFSEIFGSNDPVQKFCDVAFELDLTKDMTYPGLPVPTKICRREYLARARQCVADGEQLIKNIPRGSTSRRIVEINLKKVTGIRNAFINQMSAEARPMPYAVCVTGQPGIGKGLLIDVFGMIFSSVKGRKYDQSHVYHRQATEDYWSGYAPDSQPIIHYSEPGSLHKGIAMTRGDPVMQEWLSICDNQPYSCNMADVDSKGKVFANPELILMDCNDESMNLDVIVNNPAAVKRRIVYVRPVVKKEFLKEGSCRLDQAKALAAETPPLDRWNFSIYRYEPVSNKASQEVIIKKNCDIYELTEFFKEHMTEHIKMQEIRTDMTPQIAETFEDEYMSVRTESVQVAQQVYRVFTLNFFCKFMYSMWLFIYPYLYIFTIRLYHSIWPIIKIIQLTIQLFIGWFFVGFFYLTGKTMLERSFLVRKSHNKIKYNHARLLAYLRHLRDIWGWLDIVEKTPTIYDNFVKHYSVSMPRINSDFKLYAFGITVSTFASVWAIYKSVQLSKLEDENQHFRKAARQYPAAVEGEVLQTHEDLDTFEVREKLEKLELDSKCEMPPARKKPTNGIDWDKPRPVPFTMVNQCTDNSLSAVNNAINHNVRLTEVETHQDGQKYRQKTHILGLFEDFALINKHTLNPHKNRKWFITTCVRPGVNVKQVRFSSSEISVLKDEDNNETDAVLVRLRGLKFRDVRRYLCPDYKAFHSVRFGVNCQMGDVSLKAYKYGKVVSTLGDLNISHAFSYNWDEHKEGSCGLPLVGTVNNQSILLGIHCAGDANSSLAFTQYVSGDSLREAQDQIFQTTTSLRVMSEGILRMPITTPELTNRPHDRSPLNFEEIPGLEVYGGIKDYPILKPGKSRLRSSKFVPFAKELTGCSVFREDGKPYFGPPPFSAIVRGDQYYAPFNNFVKKAGVIKNSLDPTLMDKTVNYITGHIIKGLRKEGVKRLRPVPLAVAQNGHPEDFYMRAMKPSTSGGWSFMGAKKKWSDQVELPFKKDSYWPKKSVTEQVLEQVNAYENGRDACPFLGAQLKDEPRSYEKCRVAKTRVFCMSPYDATLLNRMYLMPFYTLLNQHSEIFGTQIGINMHSTDVDDLVNGLKSFSDEYMEGDYGGFDTSMPYDIGLIANTIVHNVLKHFGYNDESLNIVRGILSDNLYPTIVNTGDIFAAPAFQPSGKYATAEDNSLRGLAMLVYAFISMRPSNEDFFANVKPCIYGDDVIAAVKEPCKSFFNNVNYQLFCKNIYGLDYTNAAKTLEMTPFLKLDQISFLKRNFVFREDLGHWVAPLDRQSIMKAICYYLPSREVNVEDQMIDSCTSALRELFFHTTAEDYFHLRKRFAQVASEIYDRQYDVVLSAFPSFEEIRAQIYDKIPESPSEADELEG